MSAPFRTLSTYHRTVILLYAFLVPLIFLFPLDLNFLPSTEQPLTVAAIITPALAALVLSLRVGGYTFTTPSLASGAGALAYGLLFAVPEEILFRGVIQQYLGAHVQHGYVAVMLSSLIFGVAHILNGATALRPSGWNWKLVGLATLGGIPLGTLFAITESLFYPILLHTLFILVLSFFRKS